MVTHWCVAIFTHLKVMTVVRQFQCMNFGASKMMGPGDVMNSQASHKPGCPENSAAYPGPCNCKEIRDVHPKLMATPPECPAWEDGRHCFVVFYERDLGGGMMEGSMTPNGGRQGRKLCACGAEVRRK